MGTIENGCFTALVVTRNGRRAVKFTAVTAGIGAPDVTVFVKHRVATRVLGAVGVASTGEVVVNAAAIHTNAHGDHASRPHQITVHHRVNIVHVIHGRRKIKARRRRRSVDGLMAVTQLQRASERNCACTGGSLEPDGVKKRTEDGVRWETRAMTLVRRDEFQDGSCGFFQNDNPILYVMTKDLGRLSFDD